MWALYQIAISQPSVPCDLLWAVVPVRNLPYGPYFDSSSMVIFASMFSWLPSILTAQLTGGSLYHVSALLYLSKQSVAFISFGL